jgi:hypothetical protein
VAAPPPGSATTRKASGRLPLELERECYFIVSAAHHLTRRDRLSAVPAESKYSFRFFARHNVELDHDPGVVTAYDYEVNGLAGA